MKGYFWDEKTNGWNSEEIGYFEESGAGPRHFVFNLKGDIMYLLNELESTVSVLEVKENYGLNRVQKISTLPKDYKGSNDCAAIRLSPDGKFLYSSNRGHDTISIFEISSIDGTLTLVDIAVCGGKHPRDFNIDPSGEFLVVACRDDNKVFVWKRDSKTGNLEKMVSSIELKTPVNVCIL